MDISTTPRLTAGPSGGAHKQARSAWHWYLGALSTIAVILVSAIAALAIVVAVVTRLSPKGEYVFFGHPVMTVLSGSMTPVIRTGDLIIDDPVTAGQAGHLHVGQIISFREAPGSQAVITHRIVAVQDQHGAVSYLTKGDANNAPDATPRPAADVVGVFRFAIPRGGYFLAALHRPLVLGLLIASPLLWFFAGPLFRLARRPDEPGGGEPGDQASPGERAVP